MIKHDESTIVHLKIYFFVLLDVTLISVSYFSLIFLTPRTSRHALTIASCATLRLRLKREALDGKQKRSMMGNNVRRTENEWNVALKSDPWERAYWNGVSWRCSCSLCWAVQVKTSSNDNLLLMLASEPSRESHTQNNIAVIIKWVFCFMFFLFMAVWRRTWKIYWLLAGVEKCQRTFSDRWNWVNPWRCLKLYRITRLQSWLWLHCPNPTSIFRAAFDLFAKRVTFTTWHMWPRELYEIRWPSLNTLSLASDRN